MTTKDVIISTNIKLRNDGMPYSSAKAPDDRGVAVYFKKWNEDTRAYEDMCIACDTFDQVGCNLHAIGLSIEAMRGIDRWGCSELMNRAFAGFKALPEQGSVNVTYASPYEILEVMTGCPREVAYNAYRAAAKKYHPEGTNPNVDMFHQVTNAWEKLKTLHNWN